MHRDHNRSFSDNQRPRSHWTRSFINNWSIRNNRKSGRHGTNWRFLADFNFFGSWINGGSCNPRSHSRSVRLSITWRLLPRSWPVLVALLHLHQRHSLSRGKFFKKFSNSKFQFWIFELTQTCPGGAVFDPATMKCTAPSHATCFGNLNFLNKVEWSFNVNQLHRVNSQNIHNRRIDFQSRRVRLSATRRLLRQSQRLPHVLHLRQQRSFPYRTLSIHLIRIRTKF